MAPSQSSVTHRTFPHDSRHGVRRAATLFTAAALAWSSACSGLISSPGEDEASYYGATGRSPDGRNPDGSSSGTDKPGTSGSGTGSTVGKGVSPLSDACDDAPLIAPAPLVRLTNREYRNTLADLFPGMTMPADVLPVDNKNDGFDTIATAQSIVSAHIEGYATQASAIAQLVVADLGRYVPCAAGQAVPSNACADEFLSTFVTRAYRRPPTDDELGYVRSLFDEANSQWGFSKAIELVVRGVLQSPSFLYRVELAETDYADAQTTALSGYEVASRLSYLLWD